MWHNIAAKSVPIFIRKFRISESLEGFIPKTETANHMEVACPLHIEVNRGQANIETVMKDILALTKLNYNACIYGDGLPVTLRFSDKIGDILTAIPEVNWAAKPFKYYI